jgi:hypothetical protein
MNARLVPDGFEIPRVLETEKYRLRMLTIHDVVKDYDAMMSRIKPDPDLTLEQNLIDLGWHQKEFQRRSSFTYTVMNLDESRCLGCVYIYPSSTPGVDADIYLWVRKSEYERGLDDMLFRTVRAWVDESWCFKRVAYPGRDAVGGPGAVSGAE